VRMKINNQLKLHFLLSSNSILPVFFLVNIL
jgi:hypothetical protein